MAKDYNQITKDYAASIPELRNEIPDLFDKFATFSKASVSDGALDRKTKELIALAIGVARRCDGCIGAHVKAAREAGATRAELAEALAVVIAMNGGPGLIYATDALRAFDQFGG